MLRAFLTDDAPANNKTDIEQPEPEDEPKGELQPIASRVLMKVLYAARMARYDLLYPCQKLATKITKWTKRCDKQLHRMMAYIWQTREWRLRGYVGDSNPDWKMWLYTDSDFASDKSDSKSVSGVFLTLAGPTTFFPN